MRLGGGFVWNQTALPERGHSVPLWGGCIAPDRPRRTVADRRDLDCAPDGSLMCPDHATARHARTRRPHRSSAP
jgi:hypothetical protein